MLSIFTGRRTSISQRSRCEQLRGAGAFIAAQSIRARAARLPADEDVLGDREIGKQRGMLVHDGDAVASRVGGAEDRDSAGRPSGSGRASG